MRRRFEIIGAPFDHGACEAGSSAAPQVLREKMLSKHLRWLTSKWGVDVIDGGDVPAPSAPGPQLTAEVRTRLLSDYAPALFQRVLGLYGEGKTPLVIGGDHSVAVPTVSAAAAHLRSAKGPTARLGLLWVDAHADLNTKLDGNPHGRAAAMLLGHGPDDLVELGGFAPKVRYEDLILIGIRDVMPVEDELVRGHSIALHGMYAVDTAGFLALYRAALVKLEKETDGFVLSFDVDACDGAVFAGSSSPLVGGLTAREGRLAFDLAVQSSKLMGMDIVEFNPSRDVNGNTLNLMRLLVNAALGWRA
jgi:arginase